MARPLRLLSLLCKLGAPSLTPTATINSCRFASRRVNKAWLGPSHGHRDRLSNRASAYSDDLSEELEDVDDKLQVLAKEEQKRQKTVKYHILRRQMTPPGAPQRKLTWDAIEQIRYLKQEQPEEWTIERLAEGFSVTPDVILRVLRSKFVPAPERKAKQDAKAMVELGQQVLPSGQGKLKLPGSRTSAALPPGSRDSAVVPVADQTLMLQAEGSRSLAKSAAPVLVQPTQLGDGFSKDASVTRSIEEDSASYTHPAEKGEEDEESWDGRVLTEEELEEFLEMKKPSPVMQVGKDFFDAEGNFLYRI